MQQGGSSCSLCLTRALGFMHDTFQRRTYVVAQRRAVVGHACSRFLLRVLPWTSGFISYSENKSGKGARQAALKATTTGVVHSDRCRTGIVGDGVRRCTPCWNIPASWFPHMYMCLSCIVNICDSFLLSVCVSKRYGLLSFAKRKRVLLLPSVL